MFSRGEQVWLVRLESEAGLHLPPFLLIMMLKLSFTAGIDVAYRPGSFSGIAFWEPRSPHPAKSAVHIAYTFGLFRLSDGHLSKFEVT